MTGSSMSWRELRAVATRELAGAGIGPAETEARFIVERASGYDAGEWLEIADAAPPARSEQELREMVRRRVAGEPLQYVLGGWEFRGLDLFVDHRVLIPRPETEYVVEVALEEAERSGLRRSRRAVALVEPEAPAAVADIGTGSGAIALALEAELAGCRGLGDRRERGRARRRAGERRGLRRHSRAHRGRQAFGSNPCRSDCAGRCV